MSTVTLTITTDNSAFDPDPDGELAVILQKAAATILSAGLPVGTHRVLLDTNGNRVGSITHIPDEVGLLAQAIGVTPATLVEAFRSATEQGGL